MSTGENNLSRTELALIASRLQMPLIARDYMDLKEEPEGDTRFALHGLMSDLSPAQSLVCAALTLQEIAFSHDGLLYLQNYCNNILQQYGMSVLSNPDNVCDLSLDLNHVHDDLEHTLELTEMCRLSLELIRPETLVFLDIMIPQIEAQILIVEEVMRLKSIQSAHSNIRGVSALPLNA